MKLVGKEKLYKFSKKYTSTKIAFDVWIDEAESANWETPQDIKNDYRSADFLSGNRVIFNIKGNHFRLMVEVLYQDGFVFIEWVGTHSDYSKKTF